MATTVMASSMSSLAFAAAAGRARVGRLSPVAHALAPRRRALIVRAQTQQPDVEPPTEATTTSSSTPSPSQAAPATAPNMATKKTASSPPPDLWNALAFNGPAPERINGRLAMLGFVSALAVEASRGGGLLAQAGSGSGFAAFAVAAAVLSVASLVPLLRGDSVEARGAGRVMNADAELWNGRFAMLGIVALGFTEYLTGAPFINV